MAAGCEDGLQRGLHSASLAGLSSSVSDHLRAQDRLSRNPDEGPGKGSLVCQVRFPTSVSTSSAERLCSGPLPLRPQFHSFIFICNFSVVLVQEVGSHLEPNPMQDDLRLPHCSPQPQPQPPTPPPRGWAAGEEEETLRSIFTLLFVPQSWSEGHARRLAPFSWTTSKPQATSLGKLERKTLKVQSVLGS